MHNVHAGDEVSNCLLLDKLITYVNIIYDYSVSSITISLERDPLCLTVAS